MINKHFFKTGIIGLALTLSLSGAGCAMFPKKDVKPPEVKPVEPIQIGQPGGSPTALASTNKIIKFSNYAELQAFLEDNEMQDSGYYGGGIRSMTKATSAETSGNLGMDFGVSSGLGAPDVGAQAPSAPPTPDYSQTNVQVQGVDEADIIKTDGKYVYAVVKNELFIVEATPAANSKIVSKIAFKSRPQDIYINGNKLVIYGQNDQIYTMDSYKSFRRQSQYTFFKVFDITDKANPKQTRDLDFEGYYSNSRMIGDYVYFVTNNYNYYYIADEPIVPRLMEDGIALSSTCAGFAKCFAPDVYYFDIPYDSHNFTNVSSINIKDDTQPVQGDVYILNSNQNMYVSQNNIYITYTKYISEYELSMALLKDIVYPRLSQKDRNRVNAIENADKLILTQSEKMNKISMVVERYMSSLSDEEQKKLEDELEVAMKKKYEDLSKELEKTVIHKIAVNNGNLEYKTFGEVTGYVLNQFSMDENAGYFRIATTKNQSWSQFADLEDGSTNKSYSNLYVLDGDLKVVGKVENLAEGEQIFSVRFMQDRAYMVTFERTDPLFAIDLKEPTNPKVLGKLKIPGFSNYLHPYDNNLLIGIGHDTSEDNTNGFNRVVTKGLKFSLFDVSDIANPKEVDSYIMGDRGSDSIALSDHKAFLFSKEKNLLAIPVSLRDSSLSKNSWDYGRLGFVGTAVFTITPTGFELKGKIDHSDGGKPSQSDYWMGYDYYENTVRRNLYIGDVLYSFSNNYLKMNNLSDLKEVKSLPLSLKGGSDFEIITPGSTGGGVTIMPAPQPGPSIR